MPPKKGGTTKASGGLTLTRGIGPQDIKLLNKLTSDSVGVGIFSSIGLTSSQFVELGRFDFSSWEDLVKKTGVTPETLKLIQETFRRHRRLQGEAGPYKTRTGRSRGVKGGSRAFAERRCLDLAVERMREMHAPERARSAVESVEDSLLCS